jgi:hypothetical protein
MKVRNTIEEPIYFDHYDPDSLANILNTQHQITNFLKKRGDNKLFQILIIIDDFADDPAFTRQSKPLHALYTRGRLLDHTLLVLWYFAHGLLNWFSVASCTAVVLPLILHGFGVESLLVRPP